MTQVDVRGKLEPFQEGRNPPAVDRVNGKHNAAHSGHFVRLGILSAAARSPTARWLRAWRNERQGMNGQPTSLAT